MKLSGRWKAGLWRLREKSYPWFTVVRESGWGESERKLNFRHDFSKSVFPSQSHSISRMFEKIH